jgi:hypothetical protein
MTEPTDRGAALFDRVADTYDAVGVDWFTPIAAGLVRELVPAPGERTSRTWPRSSSGWATPAVRGSRLPP